MYIKQIQMRDVFYTGLLLSLFLVIFWNSFQLPVTDLEMSRLATIESLTTQGDWYIEQTQYKDTVDKIKINQHFISTKPPVMSWLGSVAVRVMELAYPQSFAKAAAADPFANVYYYSLLMLFVVGPFLLGIWVAEKILDLLQVKQYKYTLLTALALGSLWFAYIPRFTNHIPAAVSLLAALYFLIKHIQKPESKSVFRAGFFLALASVFEISVFVWLVLAVIWLGWRSKKYVGWFMLGVLPVVGLHLWLTYQSTGSIVPIYLRPELYAYSGSYWLDPKGIDALAQPYLVYAFNIFFGTHGLFFYSPIFLFAVHALYKNLTGKKLRREAWLTLIGILIFTMFYVFKTNNFGGQAYGFRWFIVLIPILWLWLVVYIRKAGRVSKFFKFTLTWSIVAAALGALNPLLTGVYWLAEEWILYFPWLATLVNIFI
jgi:hypothetical protein